TTALMVTHSIEEAVFMADKIFVMGANPGRLIGRVDVDLERPRHLAQMDDPAFLDAVSRVRAGLFTEPVETAA
ncbi:MAG TPA: nitrate ABC transporter ATP-binding protein, partial [Caulobacteraceae bacterium]|nr:nitrate ABC transporter ATP-binding protein [Caulobacteraceae bacterium]